MLSLTHHRYVLSTTHLHEFKSPDRISSQAPVMSLPLVDQKLGSHSNADSTSHKFMLKGRQSGGIHRGHAWVFRAESYDTMLAWFSDIKNLTEKTGAERKEFIRRSHARSVSAGSHKAGSISSDGGIDEDEADEVPYSATASQAEIIPETEKLQQRPNPGGRFPSALKIVRDSQVPVPSSSPSSSIGDREVIAAAGALPGSGVPLDSLKQQVQASDDETNVAKENSDVTSAALFGKDSYTPVASKQGPGILSQSNPATGAGSSDRAQGIASSEDLDPVAHHQKQSDPIRRSLPYNVERHASKYGDWLAGLGAVAINTAGSRHDVNQKGLATYEDQSGLQDVSAATHVSTQAPQDSRQLPVQGAIFAALPSTSTGTSALNTSQMIGGSASYAPDLASPVNDLTSRPSLGSRVATISELHVPGEFPKGNPSLKLL